MVADKVILFPYWLSLKLRNLFYDKGIRKSVRASAPTVAIGNVAVGGTGKTPHTEMVLSLLGLSDDWAYSNIAMLSRGYKRSSKGFQQVSRDDSASLFGDEPLQIKKKFPAVTVAVDKDRVEGCSFLCDPSLLQSSKKARSCMDKNVPAADVIVLDDALQYRRLRADINIVLVDWATPPFKDALLPLGRLRDLPERIKAADYLIVTKCPAYMEDWERMQWAKSLGISDYSPQSCEGTFRGGKKVHLLFTNIVYCPMEPVFPSGDTHYIYSKKLILFSGIAKDTPLRRHLSDKYQVIREFSFPDHHRYSASDVASINSAAQANPTAVVVTTQKDSQRMLDCKKVPENLQSRMFQVPIKVDFLTDREREVFEATLLGRLRELRSELARTPRG
ncbi:MAG: tetraacyldisaccharide 4'-kinase [Bacteroidales bacterium]|nr:tetraacyldisaccharide 4'-kinase [Bacteroidales bacterium]